MRKLLLKRSSVLVEPANRSTDTSCTDAKSPVLEILGEIACIVATLILGWIAWVVF